MLAKLKGGIMERRGQAAMEFLMTYGWAILAAIIAVGVLVSFGVFDIGGLVGDKAVVTAPFNVNAHVINTSGVTFELENGGTESYTITGVTVTNCGTNNASTSASTTALTTIAVNCDSALTAGDNFNGDVTITYSKSGSSLAQKSTGSVSGSVS